MTQGNFLAFRSKRRKKERPADIVVNQKDYIDSADKIIYYNTKHEKRNRVIYNCVCFVEFAVISQPMLFLDWLMSYAPFWLWEKSMENYSY